MAFSLSQTAPSGGRRKSPARALGVASLLLCALSATTGVSHAVVTKEISEFNTPVPLGLQPTIWTTWSSTCFNAGGSGCNPDNAPDPVQSNALFSWGTKDRRDLNSKLQVTYTGPSATLDSIRFKTTEPAQALGPGGNGVTPIFRWSGGTNFFNDQFNPSTGVGTMVAYEPFDPVFDGGRFSPLDNSTFLIDVTGYQHFVTEQRMDMSIGSDTEVRDLMVAVDPSMLSDPNFNATFAKAGGGGFQPHFIDNEFHFTVDGMAGGTPMPVTLNTGDVIEFLFYESVVQNDFDTGTIFMPDAYYGDFEVTLIGPAGPTPNPVPGTALLIGAGIFGLGFRRSLSLPRLSRRRND
jgi:hypothetical protein